MPGQTFEIAARLSLPDADIRYAPVFDMGARAEELLRALIDETPWRQDPIILWGKSMLQPRLIAWYGDPGCVYRYSGLSLVPLPWTERLAALKSHVERAAGYRFNSVLVNYYRDNKDSMGFHSDDEKELGPQPVIASVSLGAERVFVLKSRRDSETRPFRLKLASGSLLLMQGDTQANYKHGIPRQSSVLGSRINLTFRRILV